MTFRWREPSLFILLRRTIRNSPRRTEVRRFLAHVLIVLLAGCTSGSFTEAKSPVYETVTNTIVRGLITVDAGGHQFYTFTVPSDKIATASGDFLASGRSGNDVQIYIFAPNDYINWANGHEVKVYYSSGKLTIGDISTTLSGGDYYLVYDNSFSIISRKDVQTTVSYSYQVCVQNCP